MGSILVVELDTLGRQMSDRFYKDAALEIQIKKSEMLLIFFEESILKIWERKQSNLTLPTGKAHSFFNRISQESV